MIRSYGGVHIVNVAGQTLHLTLALNHSFDRRLFAPGARRSKVSSRTQSCDTGKVMRITRFSNVQTIRLDKCHGNGSVHTKAELESDLIVQSGGVEEFGQNDDSRRAAPYKEICTSATSNTGS
jgi:hypothetical protein